MKKAILRYGVFAALWELIIFVLIWVIIKLFNPSHVVQGYLGLVNLLCPLLFIYFGIRYYRDKVNNGHISFLTALKVGILIALIPAFAFALIETVYVIYLNPHFNEDVAKYDLAQYKKVLSPEAFALKLKAVKQRVEASNNPVTNFGTVLMLVAALGIIITLISSVLLRKRPAAAQA